MSCDEETLFPITEFLHCPSPLKKEICLNLFSPPVRHFMLGGPSVNKKSTPKKSTSSKCIKNQCAGHMGQGNVSKGQSLMRVRKKGRWPQNNIKLPHSSSQLSVMFEMSASMFIIDIQKVSICEHHHTHDHCMDLPAMTWMSQIFWGPVGECSKII